MALFILVKRKNSKSFLGAIPVKSGVSKAKLRARLNKSRKSGLQYRIVTGNQVKSLLSGLIKRKVAIIPKKRVVRKKKRR